MTNTGTTHHASTKGAEITVDPPTIVQVQPLIDVVLAGGPGALVALLLLNLISVGFICHYIIKLVLNQAKEQIETRERLLLEKDKALNERTQKLEDLVDSYHLSQNRLVDTLTRNEAVLNELRVRLVVFESNNRKM